MKRTLFIASLLFAISGMCQTTDPILRIDGEMHTAIARRISTDKAGKFILSCSEDKTARLWDASNGKLLKVYRIPIDKNNEGKIYSCSISPDGTRAALGGWTA